jgi:tRNA-binding EMAP/Myf-like protein
MSDFLFFFQNFCDVAEVVNIHKLILAKFGYQQNIKGREFKHASMFLATLLEPM